MSGGGSGSSTSHGQSRPLTERMLPEQKALWGPMAAMLMQRAFGGDVDRQVTETGLRNRAMTDTAGATKRLAGTMASQGASPQSPLYASLNRGLQTNLVDQLSEARMKAEGAQRGTQAGWGALASRMIGEWPPAESWQSSSSTQPSQGK